MDPAPAAGVASLPSDSWGPAGLVRCRVGGLPSALLPLPSFAPAPTACRLIVPMSQALYVLFESASGYGLFEALDADEIAQNIASVQEAARCAPFGPLMAWARSYTEAWRARRTTVAGPPPNEVCPPFLRSDLARFGKVVKLTAFKPFTSAADALEQCNAVSEGAPPRRALGRGFWHRLSATKHRTAHTLSARAPVPARALGYRVGDEPSLCSSSPQQAPCSPEPMSRY